MELPRHGKPLLHQVKDLMQDDEFDSYRFLIFERPEKIHRNGILWYQVPIYNGDIHQDFLGYLPLPAKYYTEWVQLCYQTVYFRNAFAVLGNAIKPMKGDFEEALIMHRDSVGAILKYLLYARGMIIEELLSKKGQINPTLPLFNEYIIKNRFDYSWDSDEESRTREHMFEDPFSDEMRPHMRMSFSDFHFYKANMI